MALSGINYLATWERSGATRHSIGGGNEVVRIFQVRWSESLSFAGQMSGTAHPSIAGCYCHDISIEPYPGNVAPSVDITDPHTQTESYLYTKDHWALVTCRYATDYAMGSWPTQITKPSFDAGTQLRLHARIGGEVIVLPSKAVRWNDNFAGTPTGKMVDPDSPATMLRIHVGEYLVDWLYVDNPPARDWAETYKGRVNSAEFMGCAPETLLFEGFEIEPSSKFSITDPFCYTCRVTFRERRAVGASSSSSGDDLIYGWNHEYRDDGWERVRMLDSEGLPVNRYPLVSFANIFSEP